MGKEDSIENTNQDESEEVFGLPGMHKKCIVHARDLLACTKASLELEKWNIAYSLAVLALEEIGKAAMLVIHNTFPFKEHETSILDKHSDNHVKKLFWAIFSDTFSDNPPSLEDFYSCQDLALNIHKNRLRASYVDPFVINGSPAESISEENARNVAQLVESRIELEGLKKFMGLTEERTIELNWFVEAVNDETKRNLVLGKKSLEKAAELKDSFLWMKWVHEQFDLSEKENQEMLQEELNRVDGNANEKSEQKWSVRFHLFTPSHSIRGKELSNWNKSQAPIKLHKGNQNKLLVDLILTKQVNVKDLWATSWAWSKRFSLALNIATRGIFWWQLPNDTSKFYQKITDIERNAEVSATLNPPLTIEWGNNVLQNSHLNDTAMLLLLLPPPDMSEVNTIFNSYLTGLTLMGKNDVHFHFEKDIFLAFYRALIDAHHFLGGFKKNKCVDGVVEFLSKFDSDMLKYIDYAKALQSKQSPAPKITLEDAVAMKIMCDVYFLSHYKKIAQKDLKMK